MRPGEFTRNAMAPGEAIQDLVRMLGHEPRNVSSVHIEHDAVSVVYTHPIRWPQAGEPVGLDTGP